MARLTDYWPSSDDALPHQSTQSRQMSRQGSRNTQFECNDSPVPHISTPTRRDLVPKSTSTASSRKMRRLCGRGQTADNTLFQPWSAQDHDGTQARSQTTMRESPAKLGLATEFENGSPPASARPARINALRLTSVIRKAEGCSEVHRKGILFPLKTEELEQNFSRFGSAQLRERQSGPNETMPRTLPSSLNQEPFDHVSHQETSAESLVHNSSINSTVTDNGSDYYCDDNGKRGSFSSLGSGPAASVLFPPGVGKITHNLLDHGQSSVSTDYNDTEQAGPESSLKLIRGNIPSPNRISSAKIDNNSALPWKLSAIKSTTPSDDENLLSLFKNMGIDSHEPSAGDKSRPLQALSEFITPPSSPPQALSSSHKHPAVLQTSHVPASDTSSAGTLIDDRICELSRQKQLKQVCPVNQSKEAIRKGKITEFDATKQSLAEQFLLELDDQVANGQISKLTDSTGGVKIVWTKTLHTTAGRANWRRETVRTKQFDGSIVDTRHKQHASIELADKVIDDENRLLNVLAHEFCHLTTFMISGITTNPHGKEFKSWASKCSRVFGHRGIQVTTKHTYEIDFKYKWECTDCGLGYKRHSKSIDTQRHRCGTCKGDLRQVKPVPRTSITNNSGAAGQSEYQMFVRDQMKVIRRENPGVPQREILRMIAGKWSDEKKKQINAYSHATRVAAVGTQLDDVQFTTKSMVDLALGD